MSFIVSFLTYVVNCHTENNVTTFKNDPFVSMRKKIAYGFETAWDWVNDSRVFILVELFLQVPWFPLTLLSSGPTNLSQKLYDCNHTFCWQKPLMKQTADAFSLFVVSLLLQLWVSVLTAESNKTAVCISLPLTHTNSSVFPSSHVSLMGIYLLISKQRVFIKGLPPGCHIKTTYKW